jgi:hypothetical protein
VSEQTTVNTATVKVIHGPLVAPVLSRVVGMLAARAQCPVDRLDDALLVADADEERVAVDARGNLHRAVASAVGVHDDVGARLGDGELHVRERLRVQRERLAEAAEGVSHHRDVLGACGQGELDVGHALDPLCPPERCFNPRSAIWRSARYRFVASWG